MIVGVAQEEIHMIKFKISVMVLKLDLSNAYDRVSWLYLRIMLIHIGTNFQIMNWIMGCLSSVSFAMLINGSTSGFFSPFKGP